MSLFKRGIQGSLVVALEQCHDIKLPITGPSLFRSVNPTGEVNESIRVLGSIFVNLKTNKLIRMAWFKWVLANAIGLFIMEFMNYLFGDLLAILFGGLIIGTIQWLFVLRSRLAKSHRWIWCTAIGWALVFLIGSDITFIALFVNGIMLGFSQWIFYMRKLYPSSFWWIIINGLGLPLAFFLSWRLIFPVFLDGWNGPLSGPADTIVRGILFGAITGLYVVWLMSHPQKTMIKKVKY